MAFPSTSSTLYAAKSTANDVAGTSYINGSDMNLIRNAVLMHDKRFPHTQTVVLKSSGTTVIVPTWQFYAPVNLAPTGKDASACTMLSDSCNVTALASTSVTVKHGTAAANHSARVTLFYS
jgi:hypothetical protein